MDNTAARSLLQALIDYFEQGNKETDNVAKAVLVSDFANRADWQRRIQQLRDDAAWTGVRSVEAELLAGVLKDIKTMLQQTTL